MLLPALRHQDLDFATRFQTQRFGDERLFRDVGAEQNAGRRRLVVVELGDEGGEHLARLILSSMRGKKRAVAVVAAAANEENLNAGLPGILPGGHDIGVLQACRVDHVIALHEGQRADAVADRGGMLEFQVLRGMFHLGGQIALHVGGLALQESLGLTDKAAVIGFG